MTVQAVTANRLGDGSVVYLAPDGSWSEALDGAARAADEEAAKALLAKAVAEPLVVVEPYLIDVTETGQGLELVNVRETIRAAGPSVRRDLGKQAGN
ncbi:MAG: DUF2849 domain-containing protein [Alphaproteobacteria bacterium]|nr:DUF2849 domain-containing protein [Alphaproteobacteria bacterium]